MVSTKLNYGVIQGSSLVWCHSGINSDVILGSILMSFWDNSGINSDVILRSILGSILGFLGCSGENLMTFGRVLGSSLY